MADPRFDITRTPDGTLTVKLGARGTVDVDLSAGWAAHVVAEIEKAKPTRVIIDAGSSQAVASAFFSGVIRIRDRSGLGKDRLHLRCGSDRMREAARLLGMEQLVTLER